MVCVEWKCSKKKKALTRIHISSKYVVEHFCYYWQVPKLKYLNVYIHVEYFYMSSNTF